jgi:hypothetical protein
MGVSRRRPYSFFLDFLVLLSSAQPKIQGGLLLAGRLLKKIEFSLVGPGKKERMALVGATNSFFGFSPWVSGMGVPGPGFTPGSDHFRQTTQDQKKISKQENRFVGLSMGKKHWKHPGPASLPSWDRVIPGRFPLFCSRHTGWEQKKREPKLPLKPRKWSGPGSD